jgi:hypothetical protein
MLSILHVVLLLCLWTRTAAQEMVQGGHLCSSSPSVQQSCYQRSCLLLFLEPRLSLARLSPNRIPRPLRPLRLCKGITGHTKTVVRAFFSAYVALKAINGISYLFFFPATGGPDDIIELQSISISPEPPKPGQDLEITAKGRVKQTLEVCGLCCL